MYRLGHLNRNIFPALIFQLEVNVDIWSSNISSASIVGEHPAAMQHNSAERTTRMEARERICAFIAVTFLVQFASNIFGYWTSSANHPPTAHPSSVR